MSAAAFGFATSRSTAARIDRFATQALETSSPGQLLVKLFDRLLLDLARGEAEQRADRFPQASTHLLHAQDIIAELMSSLDVSAWSGGPGLMSIYSFLHTELVSANVDRDPDRIAACRPLVEPLADAWRQAATGGTTPVVPARRAGDAAADVPAPRTSVVG